LFVSYSLLCLWKDLIMESLIRPDDYPKIDIDFKTFCDQLRASYFGNMFKNASAEQLNEEYAIYKRCQYNMQLEHVLKNGYDSVEKWSNWYYVEWSKMEE
jgi:hypothetical protein